MLIGLTILYNTATSTRRLSLSSSLMAHFCTPDEISVDQLRDDLLRELRGDGDASEGDASVWELPPGLDDASQLEPTSVAVLAKSGAVTASAALVLGVELAVSAFRRHVHEGRLTSNHLRSAPLASSTHSPSPRDVATQLTTVSGIVLSRHIVEKCVLRYRMHELERRCATLIAQCDALTREIIRTCATPTLIGTVTLADETVRGSAALRPFWMDIPRQMEAQVQRWKHLQRQETSLALRAAAVANTTSGTGRAGAPPQQHFHLHRDTSEILQRWDDALKLVTAHSTYSTATGTGNPQLRWAADDDDEDDGGSGVAAAVLRVRGDDDANIARAGIVGSHDSPIEGANRRSPRAPSTRCEPIFLCRRCRQDARTTMEYDEDAHRMTFHAQRVPGEKPSVVAHFHLEPSPPHAAAPQPSRSTALGPLAAPVKPDIKQRNDQPQRKWESTNHGIRVNLR